MKFCAEKPPLRQAANRYASCLGDTTNLKHYSFEQIEKTQYAL